MPGSARSATPTSRGNAFYCLQSNFIAYDDVALMPRLAETFGTFSVALVLAHEWGHGIQDRAGNGDEQTVYLEQQADCFAGAFLSPRRRRAATRSS